MFGVQFITHHTDTITYLDSVRIALEGGCRWIQLRMKEAPDTQAEEVARQALALCRAAGAVFIIDDRVELAGRLHADGVHLGKAGACSGRGSVSEERPIRSRMSVSITRGAPTISAAARSATPRPNRNSPPFWGSKDTGP